MKNDYNKNGNFEPDAYFSGLKRNISTGFIFGLILLVASLIIDLIGYFLTGNHIFLN